MGFLTFSGIHLPFYELEGTGHIPRGSAVRVNKCDI